MDNLNLISNFAEFKELKNIDKATMIGVLEDVFRHALQKQFETDENFDVIINPEKGDLEIWRNRTVVEDGAVVRYAIIGENTVVHAGARVGTEPDGSAEWNVATCGPNIEVGAGAVVGAGAMIYDSVPAGEGRDEQ